MKIGLVLTNDWELFGDGSGDFFELQRDPLVDLLIILKKFDAKITIFAEVGQQAAFKNAGRSDEDLKHIAEAWEDILMRTVDQGSDVQLHIHPQWLDAKRKNDSFELDMSKWNFAKLPKERIDEVFSKSKKYLETLLRRVDKNYHCTAFRGGSYCIQPSRKIFDAMRKSGFVCDLSVTQGLKHPEFYDFSRAESNLFPWKVNPDDFSLEGDPTGSIVEMPIYSLKTEAKELLRKTNPTKFYMKVSGVEPSREELAWIKERDSIKEKRYPKSARFYNKKKTVADKLKTALTNSHLQLDYDYLPASTFVKIVSDIYDKYSEKLSQIDYLPVVASGHLKDAHNNDNILRIIKTIRSEYFDKIEFITVFEALKSLEKNKSVLLNNTSL